MNYITSTRRPSVSVGSAGPAEAPREESSRGAAYGLLAYAVWGIFPLYFAALKPAGAWEILSHRILWTLLLWVLVLVVRRDLGWIRQLWQRPRLGLGVTAAALLIAVNWVIYVSGARRQDRGRAGLLPQPHRHRRPGRRRPARTAATLQWVAVAIGALAGIYLSIAAGSVALAIASRCRSGCTDW